MNKTILGYLKFMIAAVLGFLLFDTAMLVGALYFGDYFLATFTIVVSVLFVIFVMATVFAAIKGAPYVPSTDERVKTMLDLAGVGPGNRLADLGSGDGRLVLEAARRGAHAEGWEISPFLWLYSAARIRLAGLQGRAKVHLGSYWPVHTGTFDVVTLYLLDSHMQKMEDKLMGELGQGSRVVSNAFRFPGWPQHRAEGHVYLYIR